MIQYINIFGSTGSIGTKSLKIINNYFPNIKINLLTAKSNYKKLAKQTLLYKPKYIYLSDQSKYKKIKNEINNNKVYILDNNELFDYLIKNHSDLTILSISGYESLKYIQSIVINTKNLGLVNKECIVSAGNIIKKLGNKYDTNIFALDSEHFSIQNYLDNNLNFKKNNLRRLFLTASGGPFLNKNNNDVKLATFKEAINHPKWNMGNKNSIDSATLVNKCLEIIEAHYLFEIEYKKLEIIICVPILNIVHCAFDTIVLP